MNIFLDFVFLLLNLRFRLRFISFPMILFLCLHFCWSGICIRLMQIILYFVLLFWSTNNNNVYISHLIHAFNVMVHVLFTSFLLTIYGNDFYRIQRQIFMCVWQESTLFLLNGLFFRYFFQFSSTPWLIMTLEFPTFIFFSHPAT